MAKMVGGLFGGFNDCKILSSGMIDDCENILTIKNQKIKI